jgi:hypothetical protein
VFSYTNSVSWEVEYTDEFADWWGTLTIEEQEAVAQRVELLAAEGPALKRPVVGEITGSAHDPQMKELRVGSIRVLFVFDPRQAAILPLGGDKAGDWKSWYGHAIPEADRLYSEHLKQLRKEGLI